MTDGWWAYIGLGAIYNHGAVHHAAHQYVNGTNFTNTLEGFWSLFKRAVIGIYHSIRSKHVHNYLYEFAYRCNTRKFSAHIKF